MAIKISDNIYNNKSVFDLGMNFNLQYPQDLFAPRHGGNFMIIYINEQQILAGTNTSLSINRPVLNAEGNPVTLQGPRKITASTSTNVSRRVNATTVTTGAIALFIPGQLNVSYNMSYEALDLGFTVGAALNLDVGSMTKGALASVTTTEGMTSTVMAAMKKIESLSGIAGEFSQPITQGVQAAVGVALNPFKQLLFSGLNFRKFNFNFTMYPRVQQEAVAINQIIEVLKYHMHPEEKELTGGRFFVVPSDFDIEFYRINEVGDDPKRSEDASVFENEFLFAMSTCVLTDMTVNYTPAPEGFITHKDGTPLGVSVQLSFAETEILTKKRILELNKQKYLRREKPTAGIG